MKVAQELITQHNNYNSNNSNEKSINNNDNADNNIASLIFGNNAFLHHAQRCLN